MRNVANNLTTIGIVLNGGKGNFFQDKAQHLLDCNQLATTIKIPLTGD